MDLSRKTRIVMWAIALSIVASVATLAWQVAETVKFRKVLIFDVNRSLVRAVESHLLEAFDHAFGAGERVAETVASAGDLEAITPALDDLSNFEDLVGVAVVNSAGDVLLSDSRWPLGSRTAAPRGRSISSVVGAPGVHGQPALAATLPVEGRPDVFLRMLVPVSHLRDIAAGIDVPHGGSMQLFDSDGNRVPRASSVPEGVARRHRVVAAALSGRSGHGASALPGLKGRRLVAYGPVGNTGLAAVAEQPESEALRPVSAVTTRLSAVGGLILLGGAVLAIMVVGLLRALNTERTRLSAVLRSAAEPVLTTDTRGTIETINPAMERLAGWSESEARGRKYSEVYRLFDARGEAVGDDKRLLARAIRERKPIASHGFESFLESKDGIRIPVSITASPVIDDKGVLTGGVDVLRDVSREKEIDHMKSSLISTVSHELRTPLTMIQGFAELLLTREFDRDNSREALSQIHKSAERLGRLIEDLLSVSRIESGRLTAKKSRMELGPAIAEGIAAVSPSRQVEVQIDEDLPAAFADK
ncbi:MAG: histidine kinase dimerization/phospho-acceptor domain-containing protein, partial [Actinomycetota bacterium]